MCSVECSLNLLEFFKIFSEKILVFIYLILENYVSEKIFTEIKNKNIFMLYR